MTTILINNINFSYSSPSEKYNEELIRNLSLELNSKGIFTILGPSGIGKTTLLKLLAKLLYPRAGSIMTDPESPKISLVSQYASLLPYKTVEDNLKLAVKLFRDPLIFEFAHFMLKEFGLENVEWKYPNQLSGGMKQRVSFIKAMSIKPDILLLDEPFANIDELNKNIIINYLKKYLENHEMIVLLVTHNVMDALMFSNKVFVINTKPFSKLIEFEYSDVNRRTYKRLLKCLEEKS